MRTALNTILSIIVLLPGYAYAGTVTLSGSATSSAVVPTLNEWGIIISTLLLVAYGLFAMNKDGNKQYGMASLSIGLMLPSICYIASLFI